MGEVPLHILYIQHGHFFTMTEEEESPVDLEEKFKEFCEYIDCIKYYLTHNRTHHKETGERRRRAVCKATKLGQYELDENGGLIYNPPGTLSRLKVITSAEERRKIMWDCHSALHAGHCGINATTEKIRQRFFWKAIKEDVKDFVERCEGCHHIARTMKKRKSELPKSIPSKIIAPMHIVGLDVIGPLVETTRGYKFVLTLTDYFTKWVEFYPLNRKSGKCVAQALQKYIYRYGAPRKLLSNLGEDFVHEVNTALAEKFSIQEMVTSADHPQMKDLYERPNKNIKTRLSQLSSECQNNWDDYLEGVAFSLRMQRQTSTKFTPFFLMFSRHPRLPLEMDVVDSEIDVEIPPFTCITSDDYKEYDESLQPKVSKVKDEVLKNVGIAKNKKQKHKELMRAKRIKGSKNPAGKKAKTALPNRIPSDDGLAQKEAPSHQVFNAPPPPPIENFPNPNPPHSHFQFPPVHLEVSKEEAKYGGQM